MPSLLQGGVLTLSPLPLSGIKMGRLPEHKIAWGFLCMVIIYPGDCGWNANNFKPAEELLSHLDGVHLQTYSSD